VKKSLAMPAYGTMKPAMSPPNDKKAGAVAGSVGVWLEKCLPPTPVAMTRQMRAGIQEYFS
jgi:hypothetical protein